MEGKKPIKNIHDWNPIIVRTKGRQKNKWRDEIISDLKKMKLKK